MDMGAWSSGKEKDSICLITQMSVYKKDCACLWSEIMCPEGQRCCSMHSPNSGICSGGGGQSGADYDTWVGLDLGGPWGDWVSGGNGKCKNPGVEGDSIIRSRTGRAGESGARWRWGEWRRSCCEGFMGYVKRTAFIHLSQKTCQELHMEAKHDWVCIWKRIKTKQTPENLKDKTQTGIWRTSEDKGKGGELLGYCRGPGKRGHFLGLGRERD